MEVETAFPPAQRMRLDDGWTVSGDADPANDGLNQTYDGDASPDPGPDPVESPHDLGVHEANVTWELRQGGSVVRQGHTMASSGCPQQGSWSVDLGTLAGGRYEFRATEISMKDGSVAFANVVPFTVG